MPLVSDPSAVKELYDRAIARGISLANFCTANSRTTEAIFRSAHEYQAEHGLRGLPIVLAATANYPAEPQLQHYTGVPDARVGLRALLADVDTFLSEDSPYRDVQVLLHLDHAQPGLDEEIIERALGRFATIMYDCSMFPMEENIRRVAEFVERHRRQVWVEGAVDEIAEATGSERGHLTDPALAERYLRETGAFLIVPNLGTEHRAATEIAQYEGARAREICQRIGPRSVLHGSSSLHDADLPRLAGDGIAKVNIWFIFERLGGQAVGRDVLHNLGNLFPADALREWQAQGFLGPRFFEPDYQQAYCRGALGPKGWALVELRRRTAWQDAVSARMKFYLEQFGYSRW